MLFPLWDTLTYAAVGASGCCLAWPEVGFLPSNLRHANGWQCPRHPRKLNHGSEVEEEPPNAAVGWPSSGPSLVV